MQLSHLPTVKKVAAHFELPPSTYLIQFVGRDVGPDHSEIQYWDDDGWHRKTISNETIRSCDDLPWSYV